MSNWAAGYVLDIPYTSGFYRELEPDYLRFVTLANGIRPPEFGPGATYCELACGQGFGTALLAAANPQARFWGFDFNPSQIANARRLAAEAGLTNVTFEDWSFAQAVERAGDLPAFDIVVLHGIYSWISEENRQAIVAFLDRTLKPGGLVYVSYNCMPGWAAVAPLQRLMREHANRRPDRSDLQAAAALAFATRMKEGGAGYFAQNAALTGRMEKLPGMNRNYLAHEYLNGHWHPLYHLDVVREMEAARLTYACSATITENVDNVCVPGPLLPLLQETRDRGWQETVKDYVSNKQFRRDIFVRGASSLTPFDQARLVADLRFALVVPRGAVSFKFTGPLGEIQGQEEVYGPIADALAEKPRTVGELVALPPLAGRPLGAILQALSLLLHAGHVHPMQHDARGKIAEAAKAFNRIVARRTVRGAEGLSNLAAPAIGGGLPVTHAELLGVLAMHENPKADPAQIATFGWATMEQSGQRLMKDGKGLQTKEENLAELEAQLTMFVSAKLPIWKQLGIV